VRIDARGWAKLSRNFARGDAGERSRGAGSQTNAVILRPKSGCAGLFVGARTRRQGWRELLRQRLILGRRRTQAIHQAWRLRAGSLGAQPKLQYPWRRRKDIWPRGHAHVVKAPRENPRKLEILQFRPYFPAPFRMTAFFPALRALLPPAQDRRKRPPSA